MSEWSQVEPNLGKDEDEQQRPLGGTFPLSATLCVRSTCMNFTIEIDQEDDGRIIVEVLELRWIAGSARLL